MRAALFAKPLYEPYSLGGLIVAPELRDRIEKGKWKGIYITELPIRDEPIDGLTQIPNDYVAGCVPRDATHT